MARQTAVSLCRDNLRNVDASTARLCWISFRAEKSKRIEMQIRGGITERAFTLSEPPPLMGEILVTFESV